MKLQASICEECRREVAYKIMIKADLYAAPQASAALPVAWRGRHGLVRADAQIVKELKLRIEQSNDSTAVRRDER
jgi:hypothetical protein